MIIFGTLHRRNEEDHAASAVASACQQNFVDESIVTRIYSLLGNGRRKSTFIASKMANVDDPKLKTLKWQYGQSLIKEAYVVSSSSTIVVGPNNLVSG